MSSIHIQGTQIIDLSQAIEPGMPMPSVVSGLRLERFFSQQAGDVVNLEIVTMSLHAGTHCDAPFHFFSDLRTVDELPVDSLIGPAVVVDMTHKQGSVPIEAGDFQEWEAQASERVQPGDIVLLHTGHSRRWKTGREASGYWEQGWPYLVPGAVEFLVSRCIRALGVESFDSDWVNPADLSTAHFPAHRAFLPRGVLIIENLANLDQIPGTRCQVIALPLRLKGCSGSPVRVVAVV